MSSSYSSEFHHNQQQPARKDRKRVRFEEDDEDPRQVKRRITEIPFPKSSLLTPEEKKFYWMQQSDHQETLYDVTALVQSCQPELALASTASAAETDGCADQDRVPFSKYAEAMAMTFVVCDNINPVDGCSSANSSSGPNLDIREDSSVASMAMWAVHHTATRGVESKLLPGLNSERQKRRSRAIQGVLEVQTHLRNMRNVPLHEVAESLCAVSEILTHSAKQFASAMAVVDGTQALVEYTAMVKEQDRIKAGSGSRIQHQKQEQQTNSQALQVSEVQNPSHSDMLGMYPLSTGTQVAV